MSINKDKYKNDYMSIEILGKSQLTGEYCVQIKVTSRQYKNALNDLGTHTTCYPLTQNAWYSEKQLKDIFKRYNLRR